MIVQTKREAIEARIKRLRELAKNINEGAAARLSQYIIRLEMELLEEMEAA